MEKEMTKTDILERQVKETFAAGLTVARIEGGRYKCPVGAILALARRGYRVERNKPGLYTVYPKA